jgi:hypothetical protein
MVNGESPRGFAGGGRRPHRGPRRRSQLAALRGADVNATCGPRIVARVLTYCARTTVDY